MERVEIKAPAHLHAGNMDLTGDLGRLYGTAGFTLDYPRTVIEVSRSGEVAVQGGDRENAERYAKEFMSICGVEGGVEVNVKETIPKHLGMGSQTALALSICCAVSELYDIRIRLEETALALGRSDIVALGFHSFRCGGFIVDGGYRVDKRGMRVPPLLFRHQIPDDWFFVVCIPSRPIPAVLKIKEDEERILGGLKPMPAEMSDRLSRIMLMQVMPSIMEGDIEDFGKSLMAFNSRLGEFWSGFQKEGTYCHPIVEAGINLLLDNGAYGACQTCWGPTFYGIVNSIDTARLLVEKLEKLVSKQGGGDTFYTHGNNEGASIRKW